MCVIFAYRSSFSVMNAYINTKPGLLKEYR